MKIADEQFNRTISLADAYKVMCKFIEQYNSRGETSTLSCSAASPSICGPMAVAQTRHTLETSWLPRLKSLARH
jgi:hypothetical protein